MNADLEKGKFSNANVSVPISRITAERRQGNDAPAHNEEEDYARLSMINSNHRRRSPDRRISEGSPRSLRRRGTARTVNFDGSVRYGGDEAQTGEEETQSREKALEKNLLDHFIESIFMTLDPKPGIPGKGLVISLAGLQRMRLRKLQADLSNRVMEMHFNHNMPGDWEFLLKEYTQAVRDYDFIKTCVDRPDDPFIIASRRKLEAGILTFELLNFPRPEIPDSHGKDWSTIDIPPGTQKDTFGRGDLSQQAKLRALIKRVAMAVFSGLFLLAPMWIMVLHPTTYTGLVLTTVFTFAFAIVMAVVLRGDSTIAVMSSTAAYAAVLVVFVGTTTGPGSN
ncbi:hypothetical protein V8C34DRAFT_297876 [Trichoderma compactum]